jgi:hypothetical protein
MLPLITLCSGRLSVPVRWRELLFLFRITLFREQGHILPA